MPAKSAPSSRAVPDLWENPRAHCLALLQEAEDLARQVVDPTERAKLLLRIRRERAKLRPAT